MKHDKLVTNFPRQSVTVRNPPFVVLSEYCGNLFNHEYLVERGGGIDKIGTPFLIVGGVRLQL